MKTQLFRAGTAPVALIWIVGIAITLFCAAGVAALMGWIPASLGGAPDAAQRAATGKPVEKLLDKPALAPAAGARSATPQHSAAAWPPDKPVAAARPAACAQCGVIESSRVIEARPEGSGVGAVGGAVVGGILGNQVGGGRGRELATVAGAVGGVVAGNEIEKRMKTTSSYEIAVRMNDGTLRLVHQANAPTWRTGDHVKVVDSAIVANSSRPPPP